MISCIKAVFVIIGTIIGAGFASGQEIYIFFNAYGENGLVGICISSLILGIVIYKALKKANFYNIESYSNLLEKSKVPQKIICVINSIINLFLLTSFYIMVSGFTAFFKQEFNIPNLFTALVILIICYITFMKNIDGIANVSSVIIPILILIIVMIGYKSNVLYTLYNIDLENIEIGGNWIIKSIEYAGYNSILLMPILIGIKKYAVNNEKKISIITSTLFFSLSIIIYFIIFKWGDVSSIEIPLMYIANKYGIFFKYTYGIVVVLAIFTTMISAGYGFLQNCCKDQKTYKILTIIMCAMAIFIANLSFSGLVNLIFPVFGILGVIQLIFIMMK